ncbi:phage/plasmid primase, P4 family [Bradyrhizobium sp. Ash2021]|uniref:DNA primase family protein n=1 Tax=Bradyrhizobium sp. Ash2021 TaxID=2954771 RepID=UPI00281619D1|nr:phage/plasmid primase, P4 family [Bradyrhizobium sp. Ash2021]WMT75941.1 phage/plasmid primase, P4 family [Bradyrhizobium sp. Ash2021]
MNNITANKTGPLSRTPVLGLVSDFCTDLGNARRLVSRHGANIRFIAEWGTWLIWNDAAGRWEIDRDGAVMRLGEETILAMLAHALTLNNQADRDQLLKHSMRSQSEPRLRAMVSLAQSEDGVTISADRLDADPWLLGVQNGVIDLRLGSFRTPRRDDLITKCTSVPFDASADCPNWNEFLKTVTGNDSELQAYLQRVAGYLLTGSVREEVMFMPYGTGRNGKSTFRETLHSLLGTYALAADATLLIERKVPGGATEEVARLKGKRFVAVNETAENDQLNEARVKFITSQDMLSARPLYGHLFDFFPTHKTFLTTNHKPIIRGTDEGIWRRVHLIPFTIAIDANSVQKDFRERLLLPELSGILNWALAGLAAYLKEGLNPPKSVLASTQEYREDMDVIGQWIADRCDLDHHAATPTNLAYGDYTWWANEEVGWSLKKPRFRRHLSDRGFTAAKGTGGTRMIVGLRLKSTGTPAGSGSGPLGTLDDGSTIYDDGIRPAPGTDGLSSDSPDLATGPSDNGRHAHEDSGGSGA